MIKRIGVDAGLVALGLVVVAFVLSLAYRDKAAETTPDPDAPIRTRVLNACGVERAAAAVASRLSVGQCDVVVTGNAEETNLELSTVYDHDDPGAQNARYMAELLGLPADRAVPSPLADNYLDLAVTVLVGRDLAVRDTAGGR
jgi:hypothetical protein